MAFLVHSLSENTWLIEEEGSCNVYMYLLTGTREALLLDAGLGTGDLGEVVRSLTELPVTVLCTHGHFDHIGGLGWFPRAKMHRADRAVWQEHKALCPRLTPDFRAPEAPEPEWFDGGFSLDLGERPLEILPVPGHTWGCIAVLDTGNRWLFTGDTCCKAAVLLQFDHSAPVEVFRDSIRSLLDREALYDTTWPGHHAWPVEKPVLEQFREASGRLLRGEAAGTPVADPFGTANAYAFGDIAILYKDAP